jgi:hypothetical protein
VGSSLIVVETVRAASRNENDYTIGCGQTPDDYQQDQKFKSGRVCAAAGKTPSCQLCPHSPNYWRGMPSVGKR